MSILRWRKRVSEEPPPPQPARVLSARNDTAFVLSEHPKAYADKLEGGLFWIVRTPRPVQWTLPDLLLGSGMVEEDAWRDAASAIARKRARDRLMAARSAEFIDEGEDPKRA